LVKTRKAQKPKKKEKNRYVMSKQKKEVKKLEEQKNGGVELRV
jgi:hypothetical protein